MGACISIHHKASAMKVQAPFDSAIKPDHTSVIHPSPSSGTGKLLSVMDEHHVDVKSDPTSAIHPYSTSGDGKQVSVTDEELVDVKPNHTSMIHASSTSGDGKLVSVMDEELVDVKSGNSTAIHPSSSSGNGKLVSVTDEEHVAVKSQLIPSPSPASFSEYGSREEAFFDSQAWLDSDYEDEFLSVNGEFTPSRGNTPKHHSFLTQGTPRVNVGVTFSDQIEPLCSTSQPSPTATEKRRRLLDLFKESLRENHGSSFEIVEPSNKDGQMGSDKDGLQPKSESYVGSMSGCFKSLLSTRSTGKQKSPSRTLV